MLFAQVGTFILSVRLNLLMVENSTCQVNKEINKKEHLTCDAFILTSVLFYFCCYAEQRGVSTIVGKKIEISRSPTL